MFPFPLCGPSAPGERVEGELKTPKMRGGLIHSAYSYHFYFLSASKCGSICRAETCAHSGSEPSRLDRAILYRVGQKVRKNFEFFTISTLYVHISQKRLKIGLRFQIRNKCSGGFTLCQFYILTHLL